MWHFHSFKHGQTASIDRVKMACKNRGQKRGNEASDISKIQNEKYPTTTMKRDQKYESLQYMAGLKSIYKHAKKAQDWGSKGAITWSIYNNLQIGKKCEWNMMYSPK